MAPGGIGSDGMLGQPRTPPTISPSSMSASAMAYCLLLMNPLVPSMGSRIQYFPVRVGSVFPPMSMASATSSLNMSRTTLSPFFSSVDMRRTLLTSDVTRSSSGAFSSPRRSSALSSATISMSGCDFSKTEVTSACAAKSATVTGESSLLLTFSAEVSVRWVSTQIMDARRTASHAARISSGKPACASLSVDAFAGIMDARPRVDARFMNEPPRRTGGTTAAARGGVEARMDAEVIRGCRGCRHSCARWPSARSK